MTHTKVMTWKQLLALQVKVPQDDHVRYPVISHLLHNDAEIRAVVAVTETGAVQVDMPIDAFNALPEVDLDLMKGPRNHT